MSELVLDCSVTLSWCFPDEVDAYAVAVREAMRQSTAYVPAVWWLEVANGILVAERRGRMTQSESAQFSLILDSFRVYEDPDSEHARFDEVIVVGRRYGLSSYDASYLELAIRRGLPIATLDGRLTEAAAKAEVPVYRP